MNFIYNLKCTILILVLILQTVPYSSVYAQSTPDDPTCQGLYPTEEVYRKNCSSCKSQIDMIWDTDQRICKTNPNVQQSRESANQCFAERNSLKSKFDTGALTAEEYEAAILKIDKNKEQSCLIGIAEGAVDKIDLSLGGYLKEGELSFLQRFLKGAANFLSGYLLVEALVYAGIPLASIGEDSVLGKMCGTEKLSAAYWFALAGALTLITGEVINYLTFVSTIEKLQKRFDEFNLASGTNKLQEEAFMTLAEEQEALGNHTRNIAIVHLLSGGLYTVAFIIALFESLNPLSPANVMESCRLDKPFDEKSNFVSSIISFVSNLNLIKDSLARDKTEYNKPKGTDLIITLTAIFAGASANFFLFIREFRQKMYEAKAIFKPIIYAFNAAISIWVGIDNIVKAGAAFRAVSNIKEKKDLFMARFAGSVRCTAEDRKNNLQKPECYCYLEGGLPNPAAAASNICKQYENQYKLQKTGESTDYRLTAVGGVRGCLDNNNKFDEKCVCAQKNSCVKFNAMEVPGLGGLAQFNPMLGNANSIFNGKKSTGNLNASEIVSGVNKSAIALKDMLNQNKDQFKEKNLPYPTLDKQMQSLKEFEKTLKANPKMLVGDSPSSYVGKMSLTNTLPKDKADILNKVIKDNQLDEIKYRGGNVPVGGNSESKKDDFAFNLGNGSKDMSGKAEVKDYEYMDKKYKYENNDINKNQSTPIWKIISNRYQSTGVPVLIPE